MSYLATRKVLASVSIAAMALLVVTLPWSSSAEADPISEYDMCMLNAYYDCYPQDPYGLPRPPDLSNIDEVAQFERCLATTLPRCSGLPGDPN